MAYSHTVRTVRTGETNQRGFAPLRHTTCLLLLLLKRPATRQKTMAMFKLAILLRFIAAIVCLTLQASSTVAFTPVSLAPATSQCRPCSSPTRRRTARRSTAYTRNFLRPPSLPWPETSLFSESTSDSVDEFDNSRSSSSVPYVQTDPLIRETSKALKRASFFSWWAQVILTTISAVILVFAKSVLSGRVAYGAATAVAGEPSFLLSGTGLVLSAISIVWTWGNGARLSRRLMVKPTTPLAAAHMLRRAIRVGVTLNLLGLLCNLVAAEEIIGSLAIKVLTSNRSILAAGGASLLAPEGLQPLDVLVVQANTNSLLSQFCSLVSLLYLTRNVETLDPPSTEESQRKLTS